MMLYVFQVDTGSMMTFEMRLAMDTVGNLKKAIAIKTDIPEDKQVLLVSGGESLNNMQKVCSYSSAGTDTSPIFLFAKVNIESNQPPVLNIDYGDDTDMMEMIESCLSMQPSLDTLVARTELASDMNEQAIRQKDICENLVHDQHLQQQGWAAVTANLEDLTRAFRNKSELLMVAFSEFTKCKSNHEELLHKFQDDIKRLDTIPILPILVEGNKFYRGPSSYNSSGDCDNAAVITTTEQYPSSKNNKAKEQAQTASVSDDGGAYKKEEEEEKDKKRCTRDPPRAEQQHDQGGSSAGAQAKQQSIPHQASNRDKTEHAAAAPSSSSPSDKQDTGDTTDDAESTATTNDDEPKQSEDEFLDANQEEQQHHQQEQQLQQAEKAAPDGTTVNMQAQPQNTPTAPTTTPPQQASSGISNDADITVTLRQWIDYHDNHNSLERLIELCWRGLERFTESNAEQLRLEVQELLKSANNQSMKEIKGLEERLFGLEKLMVDAKRVVEEQSQLAASFQNNRERFSKIKDSTLLPDLSASHKQQLQMMLTNHRKMNDYRNRCVKAKHELSVNLHARLKWIMYIEQQLSDLDGKLMIYKENLLRLNRHFEIVDQVHRAPDLYLASVVEALRRRRFSRRYLHWASSIAKISQDLHESEMATRKAFDDKLGAHFLSNLFPGLARSYPPPFATKQPDPFDTKLPRITAADIQYLQANLSDKFAKSLYIPKDISMPHIISATANAASTAATLEDSAQQEEEDETEEDVRHSSNPTPPSSPTR